MLPPVFNNITTTKIYSRVKKLSVIGKMLSILGGVVVCVIVVFVMSIFSRHTSRDFWDDPRDTLKGFVIAAIIALIVATVLLFFQRFALVIQIDPVFKKVTVNYMTLLGTRHVAEMQMNNFDYSVTENESKDKRKTVILKIMNNKKRIVTISGDEDSWPYATLEQIIIDFNELKSPQQPPA